MFPAKKCTASSYKIESMSCFFCKLSAFGRYIIVGHLPVQSRNVATGKFVNIVIMPDSHTHIRLLSSATSADSSSRNLRVLRDKSIKPFVLEVLEIRMQKIVDALIIWGGGLYWNYAYAQLCTFVLAYHQRSIDR